MLPPHTSGARPDLTVRKHARAPQTDPRKSQRDLNRRRRSDSLERPATQASRQRSNLLTLLPNRPQRPRKRRRVKRNRSARSIRRNQIQLCRKAAQLLNPRPRSLPNLPIPIQPRVAALRGVARQANVSVSRRTAASSS